MTVYDVFLFADLGVESEILDWRLHELRDVVDQFIGVIGNVTFQGKPREPVLSRKTRRRVEWMGKRLQWHQAQLPRVVLHPMDREVAQRNAMLDALALWEPDPLDLILTSDVDEIPDPSAVIELLARHKLSPAPRALLQSLHHGWLNMRCLSHPWWAGTHAAPYGWFDGDQRTPQTLRLDPTVPAMAAGGWHFSFLGGVEAYQEKLAAWSHVEWNRAPLNTTENIAAALAEGRDWDTERRLRYEFVPFDETYPRYLWEHRTDPRIARHIHPLAATP